ncbi:MAG: PAS domain-containing protein [Leptolyngbyaceae cyanobacterium MAG.088]|nr:PAS domain-containing protein [Leptolyngbyaceae cyanobacterium MAG.088]
MKYLLLPLKYSISASLLLLSSIAGFYAFQQEVSMAHQRVEEQTIQKAKFLGSKTSSLLEFIYRTHKNNGVNLEGANLVVSQMGEDPNLKLAMLLDINDRVTLATDYTLRGQHLSEIPLTQELHCQVLVAQARKTLAGQIEIAHDRQHLHVFYPVRLQPEAGKLKSSQIGALVIIYDLLALKQKAKQDAAWRSLQTSIVLILLCVFTWFFFEITVARRARHLVAVTNRRAQGNLSERAQLQGVDELAQISNSFNHMADQLQQASETALWQRNTLLQSISEAQTEFITAGNRNIIFDGLLASLLKLTNSEYGFIGEVHIQTDGHATLENSLLKFRGMPALKSHSIINKIVWNGKTKKLYEKQQAMGMTFTNIKTIFGEVIMTGKPVIANTLSTDKIQDNTTEEHPPLNNFLGIPFFRASRLIGIVGIANRPEGYDATLIEFLQPFLTTCSNLIEGYRLEHQKQAAEAARQTAEQQISKQLATIEAAADGIAILENDFYQYLNPAYIKMFGYETAKELIGTSWHKLYSPKELQRFEQEIFPILQKERAWHGETVAIRKDGLTFTQGISLTLTDDNLLICVCQNISDRKAAEGALYNLSTRLSLAVKSGGIGIWEWDIANEKLTWDRRMCELYGIKLGAFTGNFTDWLTRIHPDDVTTVQDHFEKAIYGQKELDIEFRAIQPNGQIRHIKANGLMQSDDARLPQCMIGINVDISDRKQAEADIIKALEQERELSAMKSRFVSNTSHEFRTPLTVISNNAELLKLFGSKLNETEKKECLDTILNYVDHTTQLIDDVLIVNKAESGKVQLNLQLVDVVEFSQKLGQSISMGSPNHKYNFLVQDSRPTNQQHTNSTKLDSKIIQQILINLLTNAIKYSPENGNITFHLKLCPNNLEFCILDEGIGIPDEDQKHLFEPFHRATNVETIPGTGLGLSIVKHLVTIHRGNIKVESVPGKGSCFTVKIPTQWQEVGYENRQTV